jgi:hypothetical protein
MTVGDCLVTALLLGLELALAAQQLGIVVAMYS